MNKKIVVLLVLVAIIIFFSVLVFQTSILKTKKIGLKFNLPRIMQLQSEAFGNNQKIPDKYTCNGANVNPPLLIFDAPQGAKTLALVVDDPDSLPSNWSHWLVWNIDPTTKSIIEDSVPLGATEGMTDFGRAGYGGPCPPSGTHRYFFKLYALDNILNLSSDADKKDLETAIDGHILDQAILIGLYR
ncbi:MAG: putative kinase inhibitor protein [Parcubacteria group bacterium ADurb.Bin316]|nr:MAG: putative kinase inhibitor protein [Parcubacteria group bacterium ADurb.Bin316]HOZ56103.1 YbhB/YbcL family Raf kinase inhibitor-like protein [bacterium]